MSFANISFGVLNFGFPDVCLVPVPSPAGPIPTPMPFPNLAMSSAHIPSVFNIIFGGGLAENLLTNGTISSGDEAGTLMGVISHMMDAQDRPFVGSFKTAVGAIFATRLNGMLPNTPGVSITPAQFRLLLVS
jgi:hypothetical protein